MIGEPFDLPPEALGRIPLFAELAKALSWTGGPVNWDLARQIAVASAAAGGPTTEVRPEEVEELREHARLAELWLAEATGIEPPSALPIVRGVTPAGWAELAPDLLRELVDPLAAKVGKAMGEQTRAGDAAEQATMLAQAMAQLGPLFLGVQAGVTIGSLARALLGGHDLPLPAGEGEIIVILPTVDAFARDFHLDGREARLWVILHESAHRLELEGSSWVRPHLFALYHNFVAAVDVDLSEAVGRLQSADLSQPERLEELLGGQGLFGLLDSPVTAAAADQIRHVLALLEVFADRAVDTAGSRLSEASRLAEAVARRRADSGGAPAVLGSLVGVDLPPASLRPADEFSHRVLAAYGWAGLTRMWGDPEAMPSPAELGDPAGWAARVGAGR